MKNNVMLRGEVVPVLSLAYIFDMSENYLIILLRIFVGNLRAYSELFYGVIAYR